MARSFENIPLVTTSRARSMAHLSTSTGSSRVVGRVLIPACLASSKCVFLWPLWASTRATKSTAASTKTSKYPFMLLRWNTWPRFLLRGSHRAYGSTNRLPAPNSSPICHLLISDFSFRVDITSLT